MDNLPGSLSFGSWTALGIPASWRSPVRCSFPGHARPVLLSVRTLNSTSGSGLVHRDSKYEEGRLTGQAASVLGVGIKVLPMANHATTKRSNRQILLFIVAFVALGDGFNVGGHGLVNAINAWRERKQLLAIFFSPLRRIEHDSPSCLTFISDSIALKLSDWLVLISPPILSRPHCLKRSNFRFIVKEYWLLWIGLKRD